MCFALPRSGESCCNFLGRDHGGLVHERSRARPNRVPARKAGPMPAPVTRRRARLRGCRGEVCASMAGAAKRALMLIPRQTAARTEEASLSPATRLVGRAFWLVVVEHAERVSRRSNRGFYAAKGPHPRSDGSAVDDSSQPERRMPCATNAGSTISKSPSAAETQLEPKACSAPATNRPVQCGHEHC